MKRLFRTMALWGNLAAFGLAPNVASTQEVSGDGAAVLTYLEPYRSIEMNPAEGGVISEILVKEGARVTKGEVLLKLDGEVFEARLAVAEAQASNTGAIQAAESEYRQQKDRYEKLAALERRDVSSQYEVQRQLATMKVAEGRYLEALEMIRVYQKQLELARRELDRRCMKSPVDGIVVEIVKDVAESVSPLDGNRAEYLIRVVKIDELLAVAHIPAVYASRVVEGAELKLKIETADGGRPETVAGRVEYVSPVIDSASNTVRVRLVVNNAAGVIRAGTPAQLLIPGTILAGDSGKGGVRAP